MNWIWTTKRATRKKERENDDVLIVVFRFFFPIAIDFQLMVRMAYQIEGKQKRFFLLSLFLGLIFIFIFFNFIDKLGFRIVIECRWRIQNWLPSPEWAGGFARCVCYFSRPSRIVWIAVVDVIFFKSNFLIYTECCWDSVCVICRGTGVNLIFVTTLLFNFEVEAEGPRKHSSKNELMMHLPSYNHCRIHLIITSFIFSLVVKLTSFICFFGVC